MSRLVPALMTDYKLRSGIASKIMAEADKLLPPCCRGFQDCIHNYMARTGNPESDDWGTDSWHSGSVIGVFVDPDDA